jgi:hypothetical protein
VSEPSRKRPSGPDTAGARPGRIEALLRGEAALAAGVLVMSLRAPKIPPMQGD